MESDLSLLEISEEDDSLLQHSPSDEISNVNKYLSCSPLVRSGAPPRFSPLVNKHAGKASHASPGVKFSKENTDANKPEISNLCNEPLKMKRRKKGGGYNLRKSIAWNKAFFTDEGFLDPSELSMISGSLSSIQEEGNNSFGGNSPCIRESSRLQSLEEDSLIELPGSIRKKSKGIGSLLSSKFDSSAQDKAAPTSKTPRKVLSAHDVNRSSSNPGGSSNLLASSSRKRPANTRTPKAVTKESKLPRIPVLKPDFKSLPATTRSATCSNQIAKRALNVQKNVGFKTSSSHRRTVETDTKSRPGSKSLSAKASVPPSKNDMSNSSRQIPPSSQVQSPQVSNFDSTLGLIPDPALPATSTQTFDVHHTSTSSAIPSPQKPEDTSGKVQSAKLQARKPSSLRMPSPSLGFFGQPKASGSQTLLERGTLPCKIPQRGIPKLQKPSAKFSDPKLKPPRAPAKKVNVVNGNSSVKSLSPASSIASGVKSVSQDNLKLDLQNLDKNVPSQKLNTTLDDAVYQYPEKSKVEKFPCKGGEEMEVCDKIPIVQTRSCDNLEKINNCTVASNVCMGNRDSSANVLENSKLHLGHAVKRLGASQANAITEHQQAKDKKYKSSKEDHVVIAEAQSQTTTDTTLSNHVVHGLSLSTNYDVDEQSELTKSRLADDTQNFSEERQGTCASESILFHESRSFEAYQQIDLEMVSSEVSGGSETELKSCDGVPQYIEFAKEAAGIDILSMESGGAAASFQFLDCNVVGESCSRELRISAVDNSHIIIDNVNDGNSEEPLEPQDLCANEQDSHELLVSDFHCSKLKSDHILSQLTNVTRVDDDDGRNGSINPLQSEEYGHNLSVNNDYILPESRLVDLSSSSSCQDALMMPFDCRNGRCDEDEKFGAQSELTKSCNSDTYQLVQEENQKLQESNENVVGVDISFEESQKHHTGNVADTSTPIQASIVDECDNSEPSSQLETIDLSNEEPASVDDMTDKLHLEDADMQSGNNQFIEGCTNDLTNPAGHLDPPMGFDDLKENFELNNSHYTANESKEEHVHVSGIKLGVSNCSDASETEPQLADLLSWVPPETNDGGVIDVDRNVRLLMENLLESYMDTKPLVEDQTFLTTTVTRKSLELNNQATVPAENLELLFSLEEESEIIIRTSCGKAQIDNNLINTHTENQELQRNNVGLLEDIRSVEELQKNSRDNMEYVSPNVRGGSSEGEPECSHGLSQHKYTGHATDCASPVDSLATNSHLGDKRVHLLDYNLIAGSFQQNFSQFDDQVIVAIDDAKEEPGQVLINSSEALWSSSKDDPRSLLNQNNSARNGNSLLGNDETQISNTSNAEPVNKLDDVITTAEENDATELMDSENEGKENVLVIKPPPNAVPFSDEWLAAMEAAGEDILAKKTGAVQHSPTEKSTAQPGPWSPVKRKKNQEIGPFDCTKYTNT